MTPLRASGPLALAALLAASAFWPAAAQQPAQQPPAREFTVQNETDLVLRELYAAPPNAAERGPDRLGADIVAVGATYRVRLGRTRDCTFNVTAVFADGTEVTRARVDICRNPRLVFGDPSLPTLQAEVLNRSGVLLRELYAAPAQPDAPADRAWGPDRLGASVIPPGESFTLRMRTRDCAFDLRAVYADDREEVARGLDLCATRQVAFDRAGIPRLPAREVTLVNRHLVPVLEAYLSASTDSDWGPDRLGTSMLAVGDEATLRMEGGCEADIRIVFPNGGAEERRALDICETDRIVLRPGWTVADTAGDGDMDGPIASVLRLRNAGPLPIVELYTGRPGGPRGDDRLGADILPIGSVLEVEPVDPDACAADLIAVFRDGREVARPNVDLCSGEEIVLR
ncbi:hypothetical protein [Falsiroseomonas oryziterrae]|uniref:hypothetical protein n=1 Tax=Falsiroseomonas oryziterrae TaxID=2911368 RepID=UPI001F2CC556|nr:hypothetical protein [Roseomonas sp. NPKOSM-4]